MTDAQLDLGFAAQHKPKERGPGPVYQGVCAQIRKLQELGIVDDPPTVGEGRKRKRLDGRHDGLIAQARSLAASIDRESGHWPELRQASGVSLAALHERLAAILERLDPEDSTGGPDAFDQLLTQLAAPPALETPPTGSING